MNSVNVTDETPRAKAMRRNNRIRNLRMMQTHIVNMINRHQDRPGTDEYLNLAEIYVLIDIILVDTYSARTYEQQKQMQKDKQNAS